jgi:2-dehydro-3-deoxyphosphogluconate aldolase/(4S)-4-hydroxy-2-oxoglutarate aldolase
MGGAKYIKALKGPLPQVEMAPTGGVNLETIGDFLKAGACAAGVGSELVDAATIKAGTYEVFVERAKQYLAAVKAARA